MSLVHIVANRFSSKYKVSTSVSGSTGMKVYQEVDNRGVLYQYARHAEEGLWLVRHMNQVTKKFNPWTARKYPPHGDPAKWEVVTLKGRPPTYLKSPIS